MILDSRLLILDAAGQGLQSSIPVRSALLEPAGRHVEALRLELVTHLSTLLATYDKPGAHEIYQVLRYRLPTDRKPLRKLGGGGGNPLLEPLKKLPTGRVGECRENSARGLCGNVYTPWTAPRNSVRSPSSECQPDRFPLMLVS